MPYTTELGETGDWSIGLNPQTPRRVTDLLSLIDHAYSTIVVLPVEVDSTSYTDAQMLGMARYSGRFTGQADNNLVLNGEGLVSWLGDENDGGNMYVGATSTSGPFDLVDQLDARIFTSRANGLTAGQINDASDTRTIAIEPGTTPRQFLDTICTVYQGGPYEWRVNPDGSVDVDREGLLYPTSSDPLVILARDGGKGTTTGLTGWLQLDGTGDHAATTASAPWDLDADREITIMAKIRLDDYTSGAEQVILSKWNTTGNQRSFYFGVDAAGELVFHWSGNGTTDTTATSTGAAFTNNTDYWVQIAFDSDVGGAARQAIFYYSTDTTNNYLDVTWTQIGSAVGGANVNINAGTAVPRVGGIVGDTLMPTGRVYALGAVAEIVDKSADPMGDPNFSEWTPGQTSRADDAGNTWTLNANAYINGGPGTPISGLPCELNVSSIDVDDYRTTIRTGDPDTAIFGTATNTPNAGWVDFSGAAMVLQSFVSSHPRADFVDHVRRWSARVGANRYAAWVLNSVQQANQMAVRVANTVNTYAVEVSADVDVYDPGRFVQAGDTVYVWDQELRLLDLANEVYYRAEAAHPIKLRVARMEVPIRDGMGVYLRYWNGSAMTYLNLTRYVDFEEGPAQLELGTRKRFRARPARPRRINRRRLRRKARDHYRLARYFNTSP
jgi:hypothetical protein